MPFYCKPTLFCLIFIAVTMASCTIETDDGACNNSPLQPRLVINALLSATDSVYLHASKSATKCYGKPSAIENANIEIYLAQNLVTKFTHEIKGFYKPNNTAAFLYDVNYRIEATAPNLKPITSYQSIPKPTDFNILTSEIKKDHLKRFFECTVNFNDNPTQSNYYVISVFKLDSILDPLDSLKYHRVKHRFVGSTKDPSVQKPVDDLKQNFIGVAFMLNDELFNGQNHQTNITVFVPEVLSTNPINIMVELKTLTEDHFKYLFTKARNKAAADNPFSQPVQIHSNIKNGLGIFGGYSTVQKKARIINVNS